MSSSTGCLGKRKDHTNEYESAKSNIDTSRTKHSDKTIETSKKVSDVTRQLQESADRSAKNASEASSMRPKKIQRKLSYPGQSAVFRLENMEFLISEFDPDYKKTTFLSVNKDALIEKITLLQLPSGLTVEINFQSPEESNKLLKYFNDLGISDSIDRYSCLSVIRFVFYPGCNALDDVQKLIFILKENNNFQGDRSLDDCIQHFLKMEEIESSVKEVEASK